MKLWSLAALIGLASTAWVATPPPRYRIAVPLGPSMPILLMQIAPPEDVGSRPVTVQVALWVGNVEDIGSRPVTIQVTIGNPNEIRGVGSRPATIQVSPVNAFAINEVGSRPVTVQYDPFRNVDVGTRPITLDGSSSLTVNVTFQGLSISLAPPQLQVELTTLDSVPTAISSFTTNHTSGVFLRSVPTRQRLLMRIEQVGTFLSKAMVIDCRGATSSASITLRNGDVNADNEVGPADFTLLSAAFGSSLGDPNYLASADLNKDDEVGPADFTLLSGSFGMMGD